MCYSALVTSPAPLCSPHHGEIQVQGCGLRMWPSALHEEIKRRGPTTAGLKRLTQQGDAGQAALCLSFRFLIYYDITSIICLNLCLAQSKSPVTVDILYFSPSLCRLASGQKWQGSGEGHRGTGPSAGWHMGPISG